MTQRAPDQNPDNRPAPSTALLNRTLAGYVLYAVLLLVYAATGLLPWLAAVAYGLLGVTVNLLLLNWLLYFPRTQDSAEDFPVTLFLLLNAGLQFLFFALLPSVGSSSSSLASMSSSTAWYTSAGRWRCCCRCLR